MDAGHPILTHVTSLSLAPLTSDEARAISVLQVTNPQLLDNNNAPTQGGLYDARLGPVEYGDVCATCRLKSFQCPGHFGHIELSVPVFHPLFMVLAVNLLRGTCMFCHRFLTAEAVVAKYVAKLTLLEHGLPLEADNVDSFTVGSVRKKSSKREADEVDEEEDFDLSAFKAALQQYVDESLEGRKRRGDYKTGSCFDRRKKVIAEFIKQMPRKKCERCGAMAARLKKEGHTKLVEYTLMPKQRALNDAMGVRRPNVLKLEARTGAKKRADQVREGKRPRREESYSVDPEDSDASSDATMVNGRGPDSDTEHSDDEPDYEVDEEQEDGGFADDMVMVEQRLTTSATGRAKQTDRMVLPEEARAHLRLLFKREQAMCSLLFAAHGPAVASSGALVSADMFFLDVVPVPPTKFRPAAIMAGQTLEAPQNVLLAGILSQTFRVRDLTRDHALAMLQKSTSEDAVQQEIDEMASEEKRKKLYAQILEACIGLQIAVNSLMDSTKNPTVVARGKLPPKGVKQLLEKKEGLFRMNMMGKRVNYAARSVISPDVNIETNEIGVPPVFAKKLTFPEFVTPHNVEKMRQLVRNGPNKHPGAVFIQEESGATISLEKMTEDQRRAKADTLLTPSELKGSLLRPDVGLPSTRTPMVGKRVYRHLDDGDILILNRQPTLHKPSMMCHRARILKGEKTIRMHYANCNSYNADFDGDEMNMHFPQSLIAQAEARVLANNDNQYLVPTSGNPLRGLIQDHVVAGVWMTNKDTFFGRADYFQIIYGALRTEENYTGGGRILTVPPAVWKPKPLWSGKQIITTILKNVKPPSAAGLNLRSGSKVSGKSWGIHNAEDSVHFMDGELLCGILDKSQFGASAYGLVHSVYELYGSEVAGRLLSILSRLFTKYLQHRAFTCRMDDLLLTAEGDAKRKELLDEADARGRKAMLSIVGLTEDDVVSPEGKANLEARLEEVLRDDSKMAALDGAYKNETSGLTTAVTGSCLPSSLRKPFPWNNMQVMTVSGAKGSAVNANQISCLLGQQELEGRRVPVMVSGKTLPSFRAFETAPRAGGYVAQRFLTGLRPQEYYFHCMAGREGLIDTAVKTSRSGYLQRCLVKHLEGVSVQYDHTVRNSDGSVLQFHYGDDSLDVTRQKHLYHFEFAVRNRESLYERYRPREVTGRLDDAKAVAHMAEALDAAASGSDSTTPVPPPVMSVLSPSAHLGSVSEKYAGEVATYERENPQRLLKGKKKQRKAWPAYIRVDDLLGSNLFRSLMQIRFLRGLVDPGEAVGLLAAQGVGEPSTQMTLNTFHFAGHGAANVTLGIPRLREIVMTAAVNIKTPTMRFPVRDEVSDSAVDRFVKRISRLTLSQVVEEIVVEEQLTPRTGGGRGSRWKRYGIGLRMYPSDEYRSEYGVEPGAVAACVARAFVPAVEKALAKEMKEREREAKVQAAEIGKGRSVAANAAAEGGEDEDEEDGEAPRRRGGDGDDAPPDGDADDARRARQGAELADYDEDDDGEVPQDEAALEEAIGDSDDDAADDDGSVSGDSEASATWAAVAPGQGKDAGKRKKKKKARWEDDEAIRALEEEAVSSAKYFTKMEFGDPTCQLELELSASSPKLLLVGLLERCCVRAVVTEVTGITRGLATTSDGKPDRDGKGVKAVKPDGRRYVVTEGRSIRAAWSVADRVGDLDRLYTNDVAACLSAYGVEAARSTIIREMSAVFGVYGIGVDYRHLTLIADYMTSEGGYKPFNRTGLANHVSPLLKASYETTAAFLTEAALYGDFDDLRSPSASIVMGQPPRVGTGTFDILTRA